MTKVTIDGKEIDVAPGTLVLDAAAQLGIEIPTLCYLKGYQPSTSCQVCLVRDASSGRLVPSCNTKVVEGMVIESETQIVHDARRTALELLLSEHVGDCLAPCYFACPAHMDIPKMLRQVGDADLLDAIETIKEDIALPAVLGRICTKPCEKGCRRNNADDPVAVCELKRYAADEDLASEAPYLPKCDEATGKRVAIIGAGPTGLSAAYYLRRRGHECVIMESEAVPGGRMRTEPDDGALPAEVLDAEIQQILRLGIQLRWKQAVLSKQDFDHLRGHYDAVLIASGASSVSAIGEWGLKVNRRGVQIQRDTYQTEHPDVFAAGCAVRGKALFVRSTADGKEVAHCIDQFLAGREIQGPVKPFSSRMGRIAPDELDEFAAGAGEEPLADPCEGQDYSADQASQQSDRCLACGCTAHGTCRLERYANQYNADPNRFGARRGTYEVVGREGDVLFEPGKCIKCELCIQIAAASEDALGLTFVGRGFDVKVQVPFDGGIDDGMRDVADACIQACPTGAIYFNRKREEVYGIKFALPQ